jgi:hypothetical protein
LDDLENRLRHLSDTISWFHPSFLLYFTHQTKHIFFFFLIRLFQFLLLKSS